MMFRKPLIVLLMTLVLLAMATALAAGHGPEDALAQDGMNMETPMPPMTDSMPQVTGQPHIVPLPAEYEALTNPVLADSASLGRGAELYTANCAECHGIYGLGDGAMGVSLNPPAPALAWTSQMMTDAYLFYRISEGGMVEPFNSAMPSYITTLDETSRWDLVNHIRSLSNAAGTATGQAGAWGMMGSGMAMGSGCMMNTATMTGTTGMVTGMYTGTMGSMGSGAMSCPMTSGTGMTGMTGMSGMSG
ncbi:MAG: cytochrome c, partial [Chloroflexota bacterium]